MITSVEVYTNQGTSISLPMGDVSSGYSIQDIEGLDPVKATISSSTFAQKDGTQFQNARRESRNIVLTLGLEPDWATTTVRGLRMGLYAFLMPKSVVRLRFISDDMPTVDISGRVESFESTLFSAEPAVAISVMCFDPDFIELTELSVDGTTTTGADVVNVPYDGSTEAGFHLSLRAGGTIEDLGLYVINSRGESTFMDIQVPLVGGDILDLVTIPGQKSIFKNTTESVLYGISPEATWPLLTQGLNYIRVVASVDSLYDVLYTPRHGGL